MKKLFVLILAVLLLLAGCAQKEQEETVLQENDPRLADRTLNAEVYENEDYIYWRGDGCTNLMYYDKAADRSGVLCTKPNCMHVNDPDCGGNIMSIGTSLTQINGRLYWAGDYKEGDNYYKSILSSKPDSSDRRLERKLDLPDTVVPHKYFFHHGDLYIYSRFSSVSGGVPSYVEALYVTGISDPELKTVFERQIPPLEGSGMDFKFIGDSIWFYLLSSDANGSGLSYEFFRHDLNTGETKELFTLDNGLSVYGFWPEGEDILIGTVEIETYLSSFYHVHEGEIKLVADFSDDNEFYVFPRVSDGVVYTTAATEETSVVYIWIMDWEGNTLYKGLLPMDFLEGAEPEAIGFSSDWGDKNAVFFDYEVYYDDGTTFHYFVRYDISEAGLAEKLLMSEASH